MKLFINNPEDLVVESLQSTVASTPHLVHLDGFPSIKVIINTEHDGNSNVSIISGGGSGHEPAFAGYVGNGMLAAAVAGDVFAAPSEEAVIAAIRAVTGTKGCLVLINNYTGDRLQFGAAVERAKAEGLNVDLAVVADDCALPGASRVGRRGIAGCTLVLKLAGALAAAGKSLQEIVEVMHQASSAVGTLGCSLTMCTLPGKAAASSRLEADEMEIGLGLHGEPGAFKTKVKPVDDIVEDLIDRIINFSVPASSSSPSTVEKAGGGCKQEEEDEEEEEDVQHQKQLENKLHFNQGDTVALLVNNLGNCTPLEMGAATRAALTALHRHPLQLQVARVYSGAFMTSLDMHGLSITLLKIPTTKSGTTSRAVDSLWLDLLDMETTAPAWPKHSGRYVANKPSIPVPTGNSITDANQATNSPSSGLILLNEEHADTVKQCIIAAAESIMAAKDELDELDRAVGDGDCGSTLSKGANAVLHAAQAGDLPLSDPAATAMAVAEAIGKSVGGSSGALLKILFMGVSGELRSERFCGQRFSVENAVAGLLAGIKAVEKYGGARQGDRTMLDALFPAVQAVEEVVVNEKEELSASHAAAKMAAAAVAGAEATKTMAAGVGRSTYVPAESLRGNPDPGAVAMAIWLQAVARKLQ